MGKTWSWSTALSCLGTVSNESPPAIQQLCTDAGLAGLEGSHRMLDGKSDAEIQALGQSFRDGGVQLESFHLPFSVDLDLSSFYETTRLKAVDTISGWIERSARLGSKVGIQHPGGVRCGVEVEGIDLFLRQLGKSLDVLLPLAERLDYTIAIENMGYCEGIRFGSHPEHFERMIELFDHPNLGFCLDTGHALFAMGPQRAHEIFDAMAPKIAAFHLADNAGDRDSHLAPGHGLVDWAAVFRKAAELQFSGIMCIETPPFAHGPNYGTNAFRQMVADIDQLVQQALG